MYISLFLLLLIGGCQTNNKNVTKDNLSEIIAARAVLQRVLGEEAATSIHLELIQAIENRDTYEYECENGILSVKGSSSIALTRGVYDYLRSKGLGMLDWAGAEFRIPKCWPDAATTKLTTPFRIRQAYNAVTSGYTTAYWSWERWEQELDWQVMHGFNMVLAMDATEAIATRMWLRLGLTQQEIDDFYTGPSHLPFHRMGCVTQVGGTLPPEWNTNQLALQHKLLKRMHELGIDPIIQSFAGFVPKSLKRIYPDIVLHNTLWNAGFPESQRPVLMMSDDPLFAKITKMYLEEWKKEFGNADYYLVDSFNEMELPKTDSPITELLAEYGEKTFNAIQAGDPGSTWVIQGWMFGYQKHIWTPEKVKALFSRIPNDKILILDYANDYANSWEPVNGFNGKQWAYGFVPNMGSKTAYTGDMNLYATGAAKTLASPKKNNLVGFSISGEGLENNAVIYELLTDAAWSSEPIDLDSWLNKFSINRYGACPPEITQSWNLLRESAYKSLTPHPQFGWQLGQCRIGSVNNDPKFHKATLLFLSAADELGKSPNYRADAIERAALSLGLKADEWFKVASEAYEIKNDEIGDKAANRGLELLSELDRLLESHPLDRLDRWLDFAIMQTDDPQLQKFYESNARQIITTWGPPVNDYAARVWSGLVRDFYRERMILVLKALKTGEKFDKVPWEVSWTKKSGISSIEPFSNPIKSAQELVEKALNEVLPVVTIPTA